VLVALMSMVACAAPRGDIGDRAATGTWARVSDDFESERAASARLFETGIEGHTLALIEMDDSRELPMLCSSDASVHTVIPQSVFASPGAGREWYIMCEPLTSRGYALMQLEVSVQGEDVFLGRRRLTRLSHPHRLNAATVPRSRG